MKPSARYCYKGTTRRRPTHGRNVPRNLEPRHGRLPPTAPLAPSRPALTCSRLFYPGDEGQEHITALPHFKNRIVGQQFCRECFRISLPITPSPSHPAFFYMVTGGRNTHHGIIALQKQRNTSQQICEECYLIFVFSDDSGFSVSEGEEQER